MASINHLLYDDYAEYTQTYKKLYGENTFVLIEVGSFLEFYDCDKRLGADVPRVCGLLNIQMTRKNKSIKDISRSNPWFAGIPRSAANKYIPILVEAGMTVVFVMQVTPPPNPLRKVVEVVSLSTLSSSTILYDSYNEAKSTTSKIMSVLIDPLVGRVGYATIDLCTGRSLVGELAIMDAKEIKMNEVSECVVCLRCPTTNTNNTTNTTNNTTNTTNTNNTTNMTREEVAEMLCIPSDIKIVFREYANVRIHNEIVSKVFENTGFLSPAEFVDLEMRPHAFGAFASSIEFAFEHSESSIKLIQLPEFEDPGSYMSLSSSCLQQLDVVDLILPFLNTCVTAGGKRAFKRRLLRPVVCCGELDRMYDEIENMSQRAHRVRELLITSCACDVERMLKRMSILGKSSMDDIDRLMNTLSATAEELPTDSKDHVREIVTEIEGMQFPELDRRRRELEGSMTELRSIKDSINALAGSEIVKMIVKEDNVDFIITEKRWKAFCKSHADSSFAGMPFEDSKILFPNEYSTLYRAVSLEESEKVKKISRSLMESKDKIIKISRDIDNLDVVSTLTINARCMVHCRPSCSSSDSSRVHAKDLRHPVIERMKDLKEPYVSNSISLDYSDGQGGILLYGVNSVGKSSIMKSLGVAVIMAQAGMFVPASSFEFVPFSSLFTRIGMKDDMKRQRSTFVVEMMELREILKRATRMSLVIGDELCAGTETPSALSIVGAGVHVLSQRNVPFVLATHLHELVDIEEVKDSKGVVAMHMSVERDQASGSIIFKRKLEPGSGDRTYGVEIARSLDMGQEFTSLAEKIRRRVTKGHPDLVRRRKSRYNSRVNADVCGVCRTSAEETHHIKPRHTFKDSATNDDMNAMWNLVPLCEACHRDAHAGKIEISGFRLTDRGVRLQWSTLHI